MGLQQAHAVAPPRRKSLTIMACMLGGGWLATRQNGYGKVLLR